jgi:hypothetical protein
MFGWHWRNPVILLCGMLLAGTWTLQLATLYGCWWLEGSYIGCRAAQWISISYSGTLLCQHSTGQRSKSQQLAVLHSGTCCMSLPKLMCYMYRENANKWLSWWGRSIRLSWSSMSDNLRMTCYCMPFISCHNHTNYFLHNFCVLSFGSNFH